MNHTAATHGLKRIHVISVGRQGSCEVIDLIHRAGDGLPCLSEPLGRTVEGEQILVGPDSESKRQQVRCLFSENPFPECVGHLEPPLGVRKIVNDDAYFKLEDLAADPYHLPLVVKTTRIVNLRLIAEELSPEQIQGARFVVLVRDPRATWASFKAFPKWAVRKIPVVCRLLAESLLTVPALANVASDHLEVAMYEEWTTDIARFAGQMGTFFGLDSTTMVRFGREKQREQGTPKWVGVLNDTEVSQIEEDRFCRVYMDRVGYKPGKVEGIDYSGLRSSADLQKGLDAVEQSVLTDLLSEGRAEAERVAALLQRARAAAAAERARVRARKLQSSSSPSAADRVVLH